MALKSMRPAKSKGDDAAYAPDGIEVHLTHEHLKKLGMDAPPSVGTKVTLHGQGEVTSSNSSDGEDGPRHSMRMTLHKADVQAEDKGVRGDIEQAVEAKKAR